MIIDYAVVKHALLKTAVTNKNVHILNMTNLMVYT
jgi:hypothetical protein